MAENDIYDSKTKYEFFLQTLKERLLPETSLQEIKGPTGRKITKSKYSIAHQENLEYFHKLDNIFKERILIALERLRIRPMSCDIKKLVGMEGYRFRVGDHRIIFDMDNTQLKILILKIGHRKNVYD